MHKHVWRQPRQQWLPEKGHEQKQTENTDNSESTTRHQISNHRLIKKQNMYFFIALSSSHFQSRFWKHIFLQWLQ